MRRFLLGFLCAGCLALTACDLADVLGPDETGKSPVTQVAEQARDYVPAGPMRMVVDLVLLASGLVSGYLGRKSAVKVQTQTEAREYNADEAVSMVKALTESGQIHVLVQALAAAKDAQNKVSAPV